MKPKKKPTKRRTKERTVAHILNSIHEQERVTLPEALRVITHLEDELEHRQMAVGMMNAVSIALSILQAAPGDFQRYFRKQPLA